MTPTEKIGARIYRSIMTINYIIELVYGVILLILSYMISSFLIMTIKPILAGFHWAMQQEGYIHERKWYEFRKKE